MTARPSSPPRRVRSHGRAAASVWIHVAFVWTAAAGGTGTIYLTTEDHTENLAADLTFTFDPLLTNWDEVDINCSPHGGMTNVKVWTVALTPTQIAQERDAYAITNTTGIYSATNLSNDLDTADASGQNHPFAVLGGFQNRPWPRRPGRRLARHHSEYLLSDVARST